jgi:hypothetical protein
MKKVIFTFIILAMFCSCSRERYLQDVYIQGENFKASLEISIQNPGQNEITVDNWVKLKAVRKTGPWIKVKKSELKEDTCWLVNPPPEIEENVQSNVKWNIEPKGYSTFNIPESNNLEGRKIKFTKSGKYRLWATSHSWCGVSL